MTCALSIVIPTLGKSPHLRGLLERLQRQHTAFPFEVLVVANIPQQQLRTLVNSMGTHLVSFGYLETGRIGVNFARNKGLERARGEIVLFLDDDMILDKDTFVAEHAALHQTHKTVVAIGGPYKLLDRHSLWDAVYQDIAHDWLRRQMARNNMTTQLLGGNLSFKKSAMTANSWRFDEVIGFGGAETSLCARIAASDGILIFSESIAIGHSPNMTIRSFARKAYLQGAGARWRAANIPRLPNSQVSEFLPERLYKRRSYKVAKCIYDLFFDFGWRTNPYSKEHGRTRVAIKPVAFFSYLLNRIQLLTRLRKYHRKLYATVRSAWLNGELARQSVKLR